MSVVRYDCYSVELRTVIALEPQQRGAQEKEVVAWIQPVPERTRCKGDCACSSVTEHHAEQLVVQHAEVNVELEPLGNHHVPVRHQLASVAREFPAHNVHHLDAVPARLAVLVLAVVRETYIGTRTFTEVPGEVVLAEGEFTGNVVVDNTIAERVREELVSGDVDGADHLGELEADVACHCHHHTTQHKRRSTRDLTLVLRHMSH